MGFWSEQLLHIFIVTLGIAIVVVVAGIPLIIIVWSILVIVVLIRLVPKIVHGDIINQL